MNPKVKAALRGIDQPARTPTEAALDIAIRALTDIRAFYTMRSVAGEVTRTGAAKIAQVALDRISTLRKEAGE